MKKECFKCKEEKEITQFYKHPEMPDGTVNKCKECNKLDVHANYEKNRKQFNEYDKYRHRHSIPRLFNHKYSAIKLRCTKTAKNGRVHSSVFGKGFLSKSKWLEWCYKKENYSKFVDIYNNWVQSDYTRKLTPSIDRISSKKGYVIGNLQWLTLSENCKKFNN